MKNVFIEDRQAIFLKILKIEYLYYPLTLILQFCYFLYIQSKNLKIPKIGRCSLSSF